MRPLIIAAQEREGIAKVKAYAQEHIQSLTNIITDMNNPDRAAGNDRNLRIVLPFGYRVVYSLEQQVPGLMAHLSVSVDSRPDNGVLALPHPIAINEILKAFGMQPLDSEVMTWQEEIKDGGGAAVNVLCRILD